eukprot:m.379317 g.379317  ORF g.379317 m.379317 type:complete len:140 (+) comp20950_c0_seq5:1207-1626(+)
MPLMRRRELEEGIVLETAAGAPIVDVNGDPIRSKRAAQYAVSTTVLSRILMAVPGMVAPSIIVHAVSRRTNLLKRFPRADIPIITIASATGISFAMPMCCAIFPQRSALAADSTEPSVRARLAAAGIGTHERLFYNKGL